ncbi:hypothetical protein BGX38DRAFT_1215422 [Terfezia claveryi]|nr:hypothetical protein BGX38DRAFT_1215422 [Terfezia claveryi]
MGSRKNKDSRPKPAPDPQLEESSGEQKSQRAALLPPTTPFGRFWDTLRGRSPSTHRKRGSNTPDQPTVTTSSQSLAVPASCLSVAPIHLPPPCPAARHSFQYRTPDPLAME